MESRCTTVRIFQLICVLVVGYSVIDKMLVFFIETLIFLKDRHFFYGFRLKDLTLGQKKKQEVV